MSRTILKNRLSSTAAALLVVVICTGGWFLARYYVGKIAENSAWLDTVQIMEPSQSAALLFNRASKLRLITAKMATGGPVIAIAPCDDLDVLGHASPNAADRGEIRAVLSFLCEAKNGRALRAQIAAWNGAFVRLAIRDDRAPPVGAAPAQGCGANASPLEPVYFASCPTIDWTFESRDGQASWRPAAAGTPPAPSLLSAFGQTGVREAFHDWTSIAPDADNSRLLYRFSTVLPASERDVHVQLAGRPVALIVDGNRMTLTPGQSQTVNLSGRGVAVTSGNRNVAAPAWTGCPTPIDMACITFAPSSRTSSVAIETEPVTDPVPCRFGPDNAAVHSFCPDDTIKVTCTDRKPASPDCGLAWNAHTSPEPRGGEPFTITDRNGIVLAQDGHITALALEAGLGPLIGLGPEDNGSLLANLNGGDRTKPHKLRLTIDLELQQATEEILRQKLEPCKGDECRKRGAIVIMDDGDDAQAGEILAIATWPIVHDRFHQWDLQASLGGQPGANNPTRRYAWRESDLYSMPGSLFKVVTSMAAVEAIAHGDSTVRSVVFGETADNVRRYLGIQKYPQQISKCANAPRGSTDVLVVQRAPNIRRCVSNFGDESLDHAREKAASSCQPEGGAEMIDICEAIADSSNIWFGGMESRLDAQALLAGETDDLAIIRSANRLFPWAQMYPKRRANLIADSGLFPDHPLQPSSLELRAIDIEALHAAPEHQLELLALSGFGQNAYAPPVILTSIYASLGAGRAIRPHIDVADHAATPDCRTTWPASAPPADAWPDRIAPPPCLDVLSGIATPDAQSAFIKVRRGLHSVVLPGGTAAGIFKDENSVFLRSGNSARLFAKTGTATPDAHHGERNIAGFAGWIEGVPASHIPRRIAFTCVITWITQTGATACGWPIRDVLRHMDGRSP